FSEAELVLLFSQLKQQTTAAIIINDIHRHPLAFYSIKLLTQLFSKSAMVKFDAPLSVLRAFTKTELQIILQKAIINNYKIVWKWAFRWQLTIRTQSL
ncbi:MAG: SAM-dependent methyltransferase, partial [Cyclobacteriaceae bacterium]|nr:SAM-dependent methyltransferase [Cyclobacteriaceae bacterium]